MKISSEQRTLMAHSSTDSFEVQELKRLWWMLYNVNRSFEDLFNESGESALLMCNLEAIVTVLTA